MDELRLKYFLARRLEVSAFVPLVRSTTSYGGQRDGTRGLGDVSVLAGYHLIRRVEVEGAWQHRLILGGGLKLPTGANERRAADGHRYDNLSPARLRLPRWLRLADLRGTLPPRGAQPEHVL